MFDKALLERFGEDLTSARRVLGRELSAFEALPAELGAVWLEPRAPGKWSPAQVTEHVMKVNLGMSKTLYLLRRDAPPPEQARTPGVLVAGRAQAPDFSQPGEGRSWDELRPEWLEMRERFLAEAEQAGDAEGTGSETDGSENNGSEASESGLNSAQPGVSGRTWFHPYFGDLNAVGWIRAASLHMAHHRKQLRASQT